jgi:uncharacterized protein (TIGR02145 family)
MKRLFFFPLLLLSMFSYSQIGLGTINPSMSAVLDISSTTKGLLPPRMTFQQINAIASPAAGLMIWCTNCAGYGQIHVYNGTIWTNLNGGEAGTPHGAFVGLNVWKNFMPHNLGADTTLDPSDPVQGINGNYYQWGRSTVVASAYTSSNAISGWNTSNVPDDAWQSSIKTINDPCPPGYRIPYINELNTLQSYNSFIRTGSWEVLETGSPANFSCALSFGVSTNPKSLTLPAAGRRQPSAGTLYGRGNFGTYWTSNVAPDADNGEKRAYDFYFTINQIPLNPTGFRNTGFSVRCISEN